MSSHVFMTVMSDWDSVPKTKVTYIIHPAQGFPFKTFKFKDVWNSKVFISADLWFASISAPGILASASPSSSAMYFNSSGLKGTSICEKSLGHTGPGNTWQHYNSRRSVIVSFKHHDTRNVCFWKLLQESQTIKQLIDVHKMWVVGMYFPRLCLALWPWGPCHIMQGETKSIWQRASVVNWQQPSPAIKKNATLT